MCLTHSSLLSSAGMSDDAELRDLRAEMDVVNRDLCDALQRRARLVQKIARHKRALGLPMIDTARERSMLDALLQAPGEGFGRDELARVFTQLLACYRDLCVRTGNAP